jgi:hypothetical protein
MLGEVRPGCDRLGQVISGYVMFRIGHDFRCAKDNSFCQVMSG